MASVSISAGYKTCWSQSGSTVKYESNLGPTVAATSSEGGLVTGVSASIGSTSVSNGKCTYPVTITLNYSIPDGYSETSSSSGATAATISGSAMVQYNGVPNYYNFSVSKTIYYKVDYYVELDWDHNDDSDYTITLLTNYRYVYNISFTVTYYGTDVAEDTWKVNKGSTRYQNGDILDSGIITDIEIGNFIFDDFTYDVIE